VQLRPIDTADAARLVRFHGGLSRETTRLRFFILHPQLTAAEVTRFTTVDHDDREAIVALADDELIGVARYDRLVPGGDAEVAFVVADAWQGAGLGSRLLEHLAARARTQGVERFVAETLGENYKMLRVFAKSGLTAATSWDHGVTRLIMPLTPPESVAFGPSIGVGRMRR
jgi:GNAT superfamily N-acetyltransferase